MKRLPPLALLLASCSEKKPPDPPLPPAWTTALGEVPGGGILSGAVVEDEVFAVGGYRGRAMILRWDGTRWAETRGAGRNPIWWIWGARKASVYAVGDAGTILHWDGESWSPMETARAEATFWGVWGASDDDVWAVGGSPEPDGPKGVLYHFDGRRWLPIPAPEGAQVNLFKVWGTGSRDVWVVGELGTILYWNGASWTKVPSPVPSTLTGIWGRSTSDVWIAGGLGNGVVLHYDGAGWSVFAESLPQGATGVWIGGEGVLHVSGWSGLLGHFEGTTLVESEPVTVDCLHSLWGSDELGVFTGSADLRSADGSSRPSQLFHYPDEFPSSDVEVAPMPDGGYPDASIPDAAAYDGGAGAGEECATEAECAFGLDCWTYAFLTPPADYCSHECARSLDCVAEFGDGACCRTPGPQTTRTVCYPAALGMC